MIPLLECRAAVWKERYTNIEMVQRHAAHWITDITALFLQLPSLHIANYITRLVLLQYHSPDITSKNTNTLYLIQNHRYLTLSTADDLLQ